MLDIIFPEVSITLRGELVQSNQNNNNPKQNKTKQKKSNNDKLRNTKVRERRQEGFGEVGRKGEIHPWSNTAIILADFRRRTEMKIPMDLSSFFLMSNWK